VRQWILQQEAMGDISSTTSGRGGTIGGGGTNGGSGPASLPLYTRSLPRPARGSRAGWYRSQAIRAPAQDKVFII